MSRALTITTVEDIVAKYSQIIAGVDGVSTKETFAEARKAELVKLTKDQLIDFIINIEYKPDSKIKVGDIAKMILKDEDFLTASHQTVADAVKALVPDASTSAKSIATYVSKMAEAWDLPQRIIIRQSKPKAEVQPEAATQPIEAE